MSIYIGEDRLILKKNIIAIIDSKSIKESDINKNFIKKYENEINKEAKTYILTNEKEDIKLYGSNISSTSIEKKFK